MVQESLYRIEFLGRTSALAFAGRKHDEKSATQRKKLLMQILKKEQFSELFSNDELLFFSDMLYKSNILSDFNPIKARNVYETVQIDRIIESFELFNAYNFKAE